MKCHATWCSALVPGMCLCLQAIDAVIQRLGDTLAAGVFEVLGEHAGTFHTCVHDCACGSQGNATRHMQIRPCKLCLMWEGNIAASKVGVA
jgi:hypothetical protein